MHSHEKHPALIQFIQFMYFKLTIALIIVLVFNSCKSKTNILQEAILSNQPSNPDSMVKRDVTIREKLQKDHNPGQTNASFFTIDYEKALENKKSIMLSDIASNVRYISLETDSNCLIGSWPEYHFSDEFIFVSNSNHVLVFDYNGKFITKIGTKGKGPQEIDQVETVSLIYERKIIVIHTFMSMKLLFYSFNGSFLESITVPMMSYIYASDINKFIFYDLCIGGREDFVFRLTNRKNDTISSVINALKWINNSNTAYCFGSTDSRPFYHYEKKTYFKSRYNDTVFTIIGSDIIPVYNIQLGRYQLPNDFRFENPATTNQFRRFAMNYYYAYSLECNSLIFITSNCYADKSKSQNNILYEPHSSKGLLLVNNYNLPSGILNNWDGGPEFWPEGSVNDSEVFITASPIMLKSLITERGFLDYKALHPDKKKEFSEMVEKLNENDNPVIMIVTLK